MSFHTSLLKGNLGQGFFLLFLPQDFISVAHKMKSTLCVLLFWIANKMKRCPDEGEKSVWMNDKVDHYTDCVSRGFCLSLFKGLCLHKASLSLWQLICYPLLKCFLYNYLWEDLDSQLTQSVLFPQQLMTRSLNGWGRYARDELERMNSNLFHTLLSCFLSFWFLADNFLWHMMQSHKEYNLRFIFYGILDHFSSVQYQFWDHKFTNIPNSVPKMSQ